MLRCVVQRQPAGAAAAAAVRWLAQAVGPKDPANKQAAEEAARATGAGQQGFGMRVVPDISLATV